MSNIIKMALTLSLVGIISGLLLTGVNLFTSPIMEANQQQQYLELLQEFFPEAGVTEKSDIEGIMYDVVFDNNENFLGLLALAQAEGYGGTINYYLSIDDNALIEGVYVIGHAETPGIGDVITEAEFHERIINLDIKESFVVGEDVDTVTGATVSTEAFLNSVKNVAEVTAAHFSDNFNGPAD